MVANSGTHTLRTHSEHPEDLDGPAAARRRLQSGAAGSGGAREQLLWPSFQHERSTVLQTMRELPLLALMGKRVNLSIGSQT
jgi:hypothetical protein